MKIFKNYLLIGLIGTVFLFTSCGDDDDTPPAENEEEEITRLTLTFTPDGGGTAVTAVFFDADGEEGPGAPTVDDITLEANTTYTLSLTLENTLADEPEEQNITAEIEEEDDEHMFFFSFTSDVFSNPAGDGNVGGTNRNDPMNYLDTDGANPLGLETSWTTGAATTGATFTVILKHQPPLTEGGAPQKSDTSTSLDGEDDINQSFNLTIQ